jgi:pimeloyl-ACP methyl ester carboxylesterase
MLKITTTLAPDAHSKPAADYAAKRSMNSIKRWVSICGALIAGLSALAIALAVFQPPPPAVQDPRPAPAYWSLSTGSHIAYWRFPAAGNAKRIPVIVLHGGPGTSTRAAMLNDFPQAFTARGYDVYLYDQAGSGASARLADPAGYTLARMVADLEAIRLSVGAEKMLLVANSWGAVIAGRYAAAHPTQVAGIGLLSPGPMDSADQQRPDFSQTNRSDAG